MTGDPSGRLVAAAELLAVLADLDRGCPRDASPVEAGRHVLRRGRAALGAAGGAARIVDARGACFDVLEPGSRASVPAAAAELIARGEQAWLSGARELEARFSGAPATDGLQALASMPVQIEPQAAGAVAFWFDEERAFPGFERAFIATLGRVLGQEVDRSSLHRQQQSEARERDKATRRAEVLSDAFRLAYSQVSLKHILDELARLACETPADFSAIRVLSADRQWLEYRALYHRHPVAGEQLRASLQGHRMPATMGDTAAVVQNGQSLLLPTVDMERIRRAYAGTPFGDYIAANPVSTVMVVPLRLRGSVFGVATVSRIAPEPFQPADLRFLEEVADRAAAALDNTNLLQKLTHSEQLLRAALEAGRLGAWDWDIRGGTVSWSTMLEQIHGLAPGTFAGTFEAYQHDIHPEDRPRVLAAISSAVDERREQHMVYRIIRPDGEVRWLEAQGRLIRDGEGPPERMVGVCVDVTDRKRSEEQLRQMVIALRDADQRKDQFLAMLAHELRNPLGPVLNATYLLGSPGIDEQVAAQARDILDRQVRHMARLLDDLLDVSRITRGKIDLVRELVDITALTREVVGDHLEAFRADGMTLDLSVPAEALHVHADRARLAQIIGNLLSNALKFSRRGQSVRVRVERDGSGQNVVLTVSDQGAGIHPALLVSIFEPFMQADTSLSRARGGLGLGLAVVKSLVALHGGRVSASSAGAGHGAVLRVELPFHAARPEPAEPRRPSSAAPRGSLETVLIFEDNRDFADSLRVLLSAAGYRVWVEATGRDALAVVRRVQPAIVLCDLGLPERDGYGIAADIRADRALTGLPLVAISGYGAAEDQARAHAAGFDLHITKPVPPRHLLAELARRIPRRGARAAEDPPDQAGPARSP